MTLSTSMGPSLGVWYTVSSLATATSTNWATAPRWRGPGLGGRFGRAACAAAPRAGCAGASTGASTGPGLAAVGPLFGPAQQMRGSRGRRRVGRLPASSGRATWSSCAAGRAAAWRVKGGGIRKCGRTAEHHRSLASAPTRALLSGPEGSPEQTGGPLERRTDRKGRCEPGHFEHAGGAAPPRPARCAARRPAP